MKYYTFDHPFDKKLPHLKRGIIKKNLTILKNKQVSFNYNQH